MCKSGFRVCSKIAQAPENGLGISGRMKVLFQPNVFIEKRALNIRRRDKTCCNCSVISFPVLWKSCVCYCQDNIQKNSLSHSEKI